MPKFLFLTFSILAALLVNPPHFGYAAELSLNLQSLTTDEASFRLAKSVFLPDYADKPFKFDKCANVQCGNNALCSEGQCVCPDGFTGNPEDGCVPNENSSQATDDFWCCDTNCDYEGCMKAVGFDCQHNNSYTGCIKSGGKPVFQTCVGPDYNKEWYDIKTGQKQHFSHNGSVYICYY